MPLESSPKKILLLTNSERGQSTVFLATSHALLNLGENVEIHIASFEALEQEVRKTSEEAGALAPRARPIVFHKVEGVDMAAAWRRPGAGGLDPGIIQQPRSFWEAPGKLRALFRVMSPWTPAEFVEIYQRLVDIINDVGPDVVVVDPAFPQALTACRSLGVRLLILSPNTIKDFALAYQPAGEALWRYPCVGTAFPFPVPWHLIPQNILLVCFVIFFTLFDPYVKRLRSAVWAQKGATYTSIGDLSTNTALRAKILVANLPAIEFPLRVIPSYIVPCGPIIRPAGSCAEVSPDLARWIAWGPTVYINLGTHVKLPLRNAVEMARALRTAMDAARRTPEGREAKLAGLQVLWKLVKAKGLDEGDYPVDEPGCELHDVLGEYMDSDAVRVVEWIEPEPIAVLQEKNVVLSMHHGGANSFLEAVSAGVPQIVLGVWMDTYDFANRAELLEIGIWGNKTCRPDCSASELGPALVDALMGPRSARMKHRAKALAKLCASNGGGRVVAAKAILAEIEDPEP